MEYVSTSEIAKIVKEAHWLYSKFGNDTYQDIPGLCKIAFITNDKKLEEYEGDGTMKDRQDLEVIKYEKTADIVSDVKSIIDSAQKRALYISLQSSIRSILRLWTQ